MNAKDKAIQELINVLEGITDNMGGQGWNTLSDLRIIAKDGIISPETLYLNATYQYPFSGEKVFENLLEDELKKAGLDPSDFMAKASTAMSNHMQDGVLNLSDKMCTSIHPNTILGLSGGGLLLLCCIGALIYFTSRGLPPISY